MATYAGNLNNGSLPFDGLSSGAGTISAPPTGVNLALRTIEDSGFNTEVIAAVFPSRTDTGDYNTAFSYIWYNRIHLTPDPLNFGNILAPTSAQVEVWNAYFVSRTLNTLGLTNLEGVSHIAGAVPQAFNALEPLYYTFQAGTDGPPSISGYATFTFAGNIVVILDMIGTRSLIFHYRADWTDPPVEEYEYLTEVLTALTGKEQRISLRTHPRRTVEMSYRLKDPATRAKFRAQLYAGAPYQFSIALWQDASYLTQPASLGASTIYCDTTGRDFEVGNTALIVVGDTFEAVTVSAVNVGSLDLSTVTGQAWGEGAYVVPVRGAFLPPDNQLGTWSAITDQMDYATLRWNLLAGESSTNRPASLSPTIYRGWPVLERESSYNDDRPFGVSQLIEELDGGLAPPARFIVGDRAVHIIPYQRLLRDRADMATFFAWMDQWRGMLVSFWYPSYSPDLVLTQDLATADVNIVVENYNYELFYNLTDNRRDIAIIPISGSIIYRRVTAVTASAGNTETLTLDSSIGVDLMRDEIRCVSFLHPCRLGSDLIKFNFETNEAARVTINFTELTTTD